jgi:antitoxin (DNA-binding transcriptional repressor) of toxin-antitoxin stability system
MKIMARHGSASPRKEALSRKETSARKEASLSKETAQQIDASLKRRARLLLTNSSIPGRTRSLIRYALQIKDPYLAQVVRRVEAGEMTIDHLQLE